MIATARRSIATTRRSEEFERPISGGFERQAQRLLSGELIEVAR
jgi:hypothetical protein